MWGLARPHEPAVQCTAAQGACEHAAALCRRQSGTAISPASWSAGQPGLRC